MKLKVNEQEQEQDPNESVRNKTLKPSSEMLNLMKIKENITICRINKLIATLKTTLFNIKHYAISQYG